MGTPYSYAPPGPRIRPISIAVGLVLGGTALFTVVGLAKAGPGVWTALSTTSFDSHASAPAVAETLGRGLSASVLNPWYWAFVLLLTILQWFWPARRDQRTLSVDMAVDAVWFLMGNALQFTVVAFTLGAATVAYDRLLGNWTLDLQPVFGLWGLSIFAFVLTDLLAWVSHWCHHKVGSLWRFHAVHHSQPRLNALSDNRTHVGEVIAAALIVFVPAHVLGLQISAAMGLAFIGLFYSAMLHSNIRSNLGPLKYVFMGPQAHRIHHSVLPQHYEANFGTVFSWWDFMAGTMYRGYDEYPPTGIKDTNFPLRTPGDLNPWNWFVIFGRQLAYPFQGLATSLVVTRTAGVPVDHRHLGIPAWLPVGQWSGAMPTSDQGPSLFGRPDPVGAPSTDADRGGLWTSSPAVPVPPTESPPPGWYEDPFGEGLRFWDGCAWNGHIPRAMASAV